MRKPRSACTESGQATVEAALTLPLTVFLVLGTVQMFLLLQARLLTEYAAFRAVREEGRCAVVDASVPSR